MEVTEITKGLEDLAKKLEGFATKGDLEAYGRTLNAIQIQSKALQNKSVDRIFGDAESREIYTRVLARQLNASDRLRADKGFAKNPFWMERAASLNSEDSGAGIEFEPSIINPVVDKLIASYGVARGACRVYKGVQGTLNLKVRSTRAGMAFSASGGSNRADVAITPGGSTYASVALSPKQVSGITTVEEKLIFDSPINVVEESASDLAESAGVLEDTTLFSGAGDQTSGGFTGIKGNSGITGPTLTAANFVAGTTKFADALFQMQTYVHASILNLSDIAYYMHPFTFALLQQSKASTSGVYVFDPSTGSFKIGGVKVVFVQAMDTTQTATYMPVVFGSMSKSHTMGIGRDADLRVLTETYAANNEIGVRLTYDVGFATQLPTGLSKLVLS